jgi:hypothetical protein
MTIKRQTLLISGQAIGLFPDLAIFFDPFSNR